MIPKLDRSEQTRADEERLAIERTDPRSRFVVFDGRRALLRRDAVEPAVVPGAQVQDWGLAVDRVVFLGLDGATAWFAIDVEGSGPAMSAEGEFVPLGPIQEPIDSTSWAVLAQAQALLSWNRLTRHCPACGSPTGVRHGGYQRVCMNPRCGEIYFPRTDPAIIVRVLHGERCLLARSRRFGPNVRSVLAGFVEPGERLESAVHREIGEEVGLEVVGLRYLGSQPWPFPMSLMVAFEARALSDDLRIDEIEIEAADWYTPDDVLREIESGRLALPSRKSIARRMIEGWLVGDSGIKVM